MIRRIERYALLEEIGHGGMATVFRAHDDRLDREVAVKVMHTHLRRSEEARVRFTREAKSVARLRHDNILEIYDNSSEGSDEAFIVTELLTGPTLKAFISGLFERGGTVPAEVAASVGVELAKALAAAHKAGVIHRDVKPENVLLHEARTLKLTDFGIAQMVDAQGFTATGQLLGSPGHMAPEQVEGKECDPRADIFALGTVLYYVASGRLPYTGNNPHIILKRIVDGEHTPLLRVVPALGAQFTRIVEQAMATDPAARFASAEALEHALEAFILETTGESPAQVLAAFLRAPESYPYQLEKQAIPRLVGLGDAAMKTGQRAAALDYFNRVLALDEDNAQVMARVQALSRRAAPRLLYAGVALIVVGLGAVGWALSVADGGALSEGTHAAGAALAEEASEGSDVLAPAVLPDAGRSTANDSGASVSPTDPSVELRLAEQVAASGSSGETRPRGGAGSSVPKHGTKTHAGAQVGDDRAATAAPREVRFLPTPANVRIGIDGGAPRPFGPDFSGTQLSPGRHVFRFETDLQAYASDEIAVQIPVGREPFRLKHTLPIAPARLIVDVRDGEGLVPARVEVEGGASGGTRDFISVGLDELQAERRYTVRADGYEPFTGRVLLKAGELARANALMDRVQD